MSDEFYAKLRAAEHAKFAEWVSGYELTDVGRDALRKLAASLVEATKAHLDNTGGDCRIDLSGHDCCHICNIAEDALRLFAQYEAL